MPRYRILDQHGLNYVTCTVVGWVDVFTRKTYQDIVLESLAYCRKEKGLIICAYVIMSNHIHIIVRADGELTLSEVLRDFKKYTSRQILEAIAKGNESRKEWMLHVFRYYARLHANSRSWIAPVASRTKFRSMSFLSNAGLQLKKDYFAKNT